MKSLLLTPFLLVLMFGCSNQKEPSYKQIFSQCKGAGSKYAEYNEIRMTQFAKNYLDLCIKTEAKKVLQAKYTKCLKKNNATYCQLTTKLD